MLEKYSAKKLLQLAKDFSTLEANLFNCVLFKGKPPAEVRTVRMNFNINPPKLGRNKKTFHKTGRTRTSLTQFSERVKFLKVFSCWRRRGELNPCKRFCRPLPSHSVTTPKVSGSDYSTSLNRLIEIGFNLYPRTLCRCGGSGFIGFRQVADIYYRLGLFFVFPLGLVERVDFAAVIN